MVHALPRDALRSRHVQLVSVIVEMETVSVLAIVRARGFAGKMPFVMGWWGVRLIRTGKSLPICIS